MVRESPGPVVVGVDGSVESLRAVDLAAGEAAARGVPLLLVHVRERGADSDAVAYLLATAADRARSAHPALSIAAEATTGNPAEVLLGRALTASLVVLGHRARCHAFGSPSVALAVVDQAHGPVIVQRDTATAPAPAPRPVLVGIEPTTESEPVIAFGFAEASLRGAPLHAMYVWSEAGDRGPAEIHADVDGLAQAHQEAERMLAEALAGWSATYPDVTVQRTVRHSLDATIALTAATRSAQLAVVGSAHTTGHPRALGAWHALVHRAGCSVAVVDTGAP